MDTFNSIAESINLICGTIFFIIMVYERYKGKTEDAIYYGVFALILMIGAGGH